MQKTAQTNQKAEEEEKPQVVKVKITSEQLKKTILVGYIIISAIFIIYVLWNNIKVNLLQQAYMEGRRSTVTEVINQAQECKAFPVYIDQQQVQLINVQCLQPQTSPTPVK